MKQCWDLSEAKEAGLGIRGKRGKGVPAAERSGDHIFQIPSQMGFRQVSGSWAAIAHLLS